MTRGETAAAGRAVSRSSWGGVVGPLAFTAAWAIGGTRVPGYRPVDDAISRLAAVGSPAQALMTAGFATFGASLLLYGQALRSTLPGPAWLAASGTGAATLGVACLPLGYSVDVDRWHAAVAATAYVTLAATPLLASRPLSEGGHRRAGRASIAVGALAAVLLAASTSRTAPGALQRSGLAVGHAWVVTSATLTLAGRGRLPARAESPG